MKLWTLEMEPCLLFLSALHQFPHKMPSLPS